MIDIFPNGGIANRMRSMVSLMQFAEELNRPVSFLWFKDWQFNAEFVDLFEPLENIEFKKIWYITTWQSRVLPSRGDYSRFKRWKVNRQNKKWGYDLALFNDDVRELRNNMDSFRQLVSDHNKVAILTGEEIPHDHKSYSKYLKPSSPILQKVNDISKGFNGNTIGVHIRRTDNVDSIKNSPLELFTKQIDLAVDQGFKIFLATDDPEVEKMYLKRHAKNVLVNSAKNFNRDDVDGLKDAMVDLYCLSNTTHVYGSYWSSFTNVAARINQIPLTILKL